MPRFFEDRSNFKSNNVTVTGDNFNHLSKVLRAEIGDEIVVTDDYGIDYICVINGIFSDKITARIEDFTKNENEPDVKIHLFQCVPKFDKMDSVVQKCVELGAFKIYPVVSARCVAKISEERGVKRVTRWRRISESAAKQSGRGIIPDVSDIISFEEAVALASKMDVKVVPYEREQEGSFRNLDVANAKSAAIIIGPEGGFSDEEIEICVKNEIVPITLGKRILRTETAGINAISILLFMLERF